MDIPQASNPLLQHILDTYASESNKVAAVWSCFHAEDLDYRPHPRSSTVREIPRHQILSERRFFAEFLGLDEPPAAEALPNDDTIPTYIARFKELAAPRLAKLALKPDPWWLEETRFFDVPRQRIWIFWRRVLHTAHHRTQLSVYLRLLDRPVPSTYGPTADVTWTGADPTLK